MKSVFKKLSRLICLLLIVAMSLSIVACGDNGDEGETPVSPGELPDKVIDIDDPETTLPEGINEFGTHIYTAPAIADKWLVKNGATEYKLVVPADTIERDKKFFNDSKKELLTFFAQATGVVLEVVIDDTLPVTTHTAEQKYISLGKTTLLDSLEGDKAFDYSQEEVGKNGGKIKTIDNNVYITGATDNGTLNTVYTFLSVTFNWECYSANTVVIDENVENLNLYAYDVFDIPDVIYASTSTYERGSFSYSSDWGYSYSHATEGGQMYGTRMRVTDKKGVQPYHIFEGEPEDLTDEEFDAIDVTSGHNSLAIMDSTKYKNIHPDWFSQPTGVQLCYTARGNEEEFESMVEHLANAYILTYMQYPVDEYPYQDTVHITTSDDMTMCVCDECRRYRQLGYQDSGMVIRLLNNVAEKVKEWMEEPGNEAYRRDDFKILFLAYYATEMAPAEPAADGIGWEPVISMSPNVEVNWAPIFADFMQSFFSEDNKTYKDIFDKWIAVSNGNLSYYMYNYNCNYHNYFYDAFDFYNTEFFNYALSRGRLEYYSENIHGASPTEWGALTSYMAAKLCYDSTLDSGKLLKNWFNAVFGAGAGAMMDMFNQMRVFSHMEMMRLDKYGERTNRVQSQTTFNWDLEIIQGWIDKADTAIALIDHLKETDPEEYERICYNIELEIFSPVYIIFDRSLNLTDEQYRTYVDRIKSNLQRFPEYKYVEKATDFATR